MTCRRLLLCLCLVLSPLGGFAAQGGSDGTSAGISLDMLNAKIAEVESDSELADESRQMLLDLYRKSIGNIESTESNLVAIQRFRTSIETAPDATIELKAEVEKLKQEDYDPNPGFDAQTPTSEIAQALLKERANLSTVDSDYNRLKLRLASEKERPSEARKELAEANREHPEDKLSSDGTLANQPEEVRKAREWLRKTGESLLRSEINKLDQEMLSHGPRLELLKAQLQQRKITLDRLQARVGALEAQLGERRQEDATQALSMAQAAQLAAEGKHPLLVETAQVNAEISERLYGLSTAIEEVNRASVEAEAAAKALDENYRSVRQKLEVAGMNKALGKILQDQREALPSARRIRAEVDEKERLISDIALQQLFFEEELKKLGDIDSAVEELMARVYQDTAAAKRGGDEPSQATARQAVEEELRILLEQRRSLYEKITTISATYLQSLSDLEYAKRNLLEMAEQYDGFLGERLLWVRSAPNSNFESMQSFTGDSLRYLSVASWGQVLDSLLALDQLYLPVLLGILVALALRWRKKTLLRDLIETNRHLGQPVADRFRYSLQAFFITLLISVPGPMILLLVGIKLKFAYDHNALSQSVANSLIWLGQSWFFIRAFYQACRLDGLAQRHFLWHAEALKPLRRELYLLMVTFLPISLFTVLIAGLDTSGMEWGVVRIGLVLSMLAFAMFFVRLLRSNGGVLLALKKLDPNVLLIRWRSVWLLLSVLIPLALIALAASGYVYTAFTLMGSFVQTFWVVIILILVQQLAMRWLRMTSMKLDYQAMQEERKRQFQEMIASRSDTGEFAELPDEPQLDITHLNRDSVLLVNIFAGFVGIAGLLLVWSDVLPALGYLNNIVLWNYSETGSGESILKAVSLADIGLAALFVVITVLIYRTLPSLLELFMLQVLSMEASDRYTAITLTRYFILAVGILVVAGMLGISWSQFQWLAAALGVGIGFGLQEIVANFISGLIILFERPIRVGDRVTVGEVDGIVTRIRIRATTILTWDRQELLVPNKEFITGRLLNWSLSDQVSRLVLEVGVAYGSDVSMALSLLEKAALEHPKVLKDPAPFVTFEAFGDSSLHLKLRCYLNDMNIRLSTTSKLYETINEAFNEAGIVMAFPQRDVHFDAGSPLNVRLHPEAPHTEKQDRNEE